MKTQSLRHISGQVCEIFSSIQGEGRFVGYPQIFIRFSGCNLRCKYCDTPQAFDPEISKSFTVNELANEIKKLERYHQALSLTGGEPLLQADFIRKFLTYSRKNAASTLPVLLETNGTLPEELEKIIPYLDFVSMDIKLPSSTGQGDYINLHREFLKIAYLKQPFIKIVVLNETKDEEFEEAVQLVAEIDPDLPLFIQPVTPYGKIKCPSSKKLLEFFDIASKRLKEVRIIPQIHKIIGVV